jgi:predicted solute-binding protein
MLLLGYSTELICRPILYAIQEKQIENVFQLQLMPESNILGRLKDGSLQMGFLSPLSYAHNQGEFQIVSDFLIQSPQTGKNALIFFKDSLNKLSHIYYRKDIYTGDFDRFIAEWVLREIFNLEVTWKPKEKLSLNNRSIEKYEMIFIYGEDAFDSYSDYDNYIDLTEEWTLNFQLPLVHQILCVSSSFTDKTALEKLRLSRELGLRNLLKISKSYAEHHTQEWHTYFDILNETYQYVQDGQVWQSLKQLLSSMFYGNVVDYLPEIKIYQEL